MSLLPAYCDLHKHQKGRRHMKIKTKLILMEMISLFILTALLIVCSIRITVREMNSRVRETLEVAVTGYNGMWDIWKVRGSLLWRMTGIR